MRCGNVLLLNAIISRERGQCMDILLQRFSSSNEFQSIITGLKSGLKDQLITGLSGSAKQMMVASLYSDEKRQIVIVTHNLLQAQKVYDDLVEMVDSTHLFLYPANELTMTDIEAQSPETLGQRISVLQHLANQDQGIYIIPYIGLVKFLPPKEYFVDSVFFLKVGEEIDIDRFLHHVVFLGYERSDIVEKRGEFSVRGASLIYSRLQWIILYVLNCLMWKLTRSVPLMRDHNVL